MVERSLSMRETLKICIRGGYASEGTNAYKALAMYRKMLAFGFNADNYTSSFVLKACGNLGLCGMGMEIHCRVEVCGWDSDIYVNNSLVAVYLKFGNVDVARKVFDKMPVRDLTSWNTMISVARQLFEELKIKDTVSWNSIISCYQRSGDAFESLRLFCQMLIEDTATSDEITIVAVLGACEKITALQFGKSVHSLHRNVELAEISAQNIFRTNPSRASSYICLSNIYAATKQWTAVEKVRATMRKRGLKKPEGYSLIELDSQVYMFFVGDKSHQQTKDIYDKLKDISW
ncbi:hypothetical protein Csa_020392 [Cucumis sativus]|nr:hypothetical protein Csa_020392 [Cucumis sativus]